MNTGGLKERIDINRLKQYKIIKVILLFLSLPLMLSGVFIMISLPLDLHNSTIDIRQRFSMLFLFSGIVLAYCARGYEIMILKLKYDGEK